MKLVKVAAAVLNQTPLDWDGNCANILSSIAAARDQHVTALCLPELCITGAGGGALFQVPGVQRTALGVLREIVPATRGMIVVVGLPVACEGRLFNAACLLVDGRVAGFVGKRTLADAAGNCESRWFHGWPSGARTVLHLDPDLGLGVDRMSYPMGDVVFCWGDVRIVCEIGEDAWVRERPEGDPARQGVDIVLNPCASAFAFGKHVARQRLISERSRADRVSYVSANLLGNESGRTIYDGGALIASGGRLLAVGRRFSYADHLVTTAVIDVDPARAECAVSAEGIPSMPGDTGRDVAIDLDFPAMSWEEPHAAVRDWERGAHSKEEEFARAVALGLFDYLRKSRSEGFVVSLSGGADSTAVACLVALLVRFGEAELGRRSFRSRLAYSPWLSQVADDEPLIARLLSCVYQSTRNSSQTTRAAARTVAAAVGTELLELDVDPIVQQYVATLSTAIGRELSWQDDDIALQNIQARVRSPSAWLLANLRRALLLATGNRSESAVGYATMDGDTSGGLAPLAGIDKAFLRQWLVWLEQHGPAELGPLPALAAVTCQAPTAELRPPGSHQTDEDDLMPYEVLNAIERAAACDRLLPIEVLKRLEARFHERYSLHELGVWVDRFFRLWSRNQWKRERAAPSFPLDDARLHPQACGQLPILSSGFARELRELSEWLASRAEVLGGREGEVSDK